MIPCSSVDFAKSPKFIPNIRRNFTMSVNIYVVLAVSSFLAFHLRIVFGDCSINNGGCQHRCTDTMGRGVQCQCEPGYKLNSDRHTCDDIDECLADNGGCSGVCENKPGTFECSCKTGSLSMDGRSCIVAMLRCHECDTYKDSSSCGDPMTGDDNIVDCARATHCLKLKTQVTKVDRTDISALTKRTVVSRQCAWAPHATSSCTTYVGAGASYKRCYCDTDGCNRSSRPVLHASVVMTTILVVSLTV